MKRLVQRLRAVFPDKFITIDITHMIHVGRKYDCNYRIYVADTVNIQYLNSMDEVKEKVNQIIKEQNEINRRTKVTE